MVELEGEFNAEELKGGSINEFWIYDFRFGDF